MRYELSFYLFGFAGSLLQHVGSLIFIAVCRIFTCGIRTLSCGMWDLVPRPGTKPRPLDWGCSVLATGPESGFKTEVLELNFKSSPGDSNCSQSRESLV